MFYYMHRNEAEIMRALLFHLLIFSCNSHDKFVVMSNTSENSTLIKSRVKCRHIISSHFQCLSNNQTEPEQLHATQKSADCQNKI